MSTYTHKPGALDVRRQDTRGRVDPGEMSQRELLEEIVESQRRTEDMVKQFVESLKTNPMLRAFAGKFGG